MGSQVAELLKRFLEKAKHEVEPLTHEEVEAAAKIMELRSTKKGKPGITVKGIGE